MNPNLKAFLEMIAVSELGRAVLDNPLSDNGYKVIVGSTPAKLILMSSYADHPHRLIPINDHLVSTAAGRYQLLGRYFDAYKKSLNLPDFSPASQDAIALQQIHEQGATEDIIAGHFQVAVGKVSNIWASLPGAGYQQHENKMAFLEGAYDKAGGTFA